MKFHVKEEFGKQIEKIWEDDRFNSIEIKERGFAVQNEIEQHSLLFVGINPSFDNKPGCIFYDNSHGEIHKYFKKFIEISSEVKLVWSHIDLLFVRETDQKVIKNLGRVINGNDFIDEQLKISKSIIELAKPSIIVVNNTYARDLLQSDLFSTSKIEFEFDENIGTHRIINHKTLNDIPVFFTSMLTGQRALDRGSFQRLLWHIKFVKRIIESQQ
jgi:hypothetical protein